MIRRPPRSTLDRSSAASDVYKRQENFPVTIRAKPLPADERRAATVEAVIQLAATQNPVSYTHLRAHETVLDLVCRLLLEKKKTYTSKQYLTIIAHHQTHNNYTINTS